MLLQIPSQLGDSYFLTTDPASAGSPPGRMPPPIEMKKQMNDSSYSTSKSGTEDYENVGTSKNNHHVHYKAAPRISTSTTRPVENSGLPPLGLPNLRTGMYWAIVLLYVMDLSEGLVVCDEGFWKMLLLSSLFHSSSFSSPFSYL